MPRDRCDTRSVFKRITASLNSEFFLTSTGHLTKANDPPPVCSIIYSYLGKENEAVYAFTKNINA